MNNNYYLCSLMNKEKYKSYQYLPRATRLILIFILKDATNRQRGKNFISPNLCTSIYLSGPNVSLDMYLVFNSFVFLHI